MNGKIWCSMSLGQPETLLGNQSHGLSCSVRDRSSLILWGKIAINMKFIVVFSSTKNLKDNHKYSLFILKILGNRVLTLDNHISDTGCSLPCSKYICPIPVDIL